MIVEDQALIGMSLEASLEEVGFTVAGPFMSCTQALQWLEHNKPGLAVLDAMVKDGTSLQITRELRSRGVPFAVQACCREDLIIRSAQNGLLGAICRSSVSA